MENNYLENQVNQYIEDHKKKKRWHRGVTVLSVLVVVLTAFLFMKPAFTLSGETFCGMEEHKEHTNECFEEKRMLICEKTEEGHLHTESCYEDRSVLVCGQEETEGHYHLPECYEKENVLICENPDPDHVHEESCYEEQEKLICAIPECDPHSHNETCYETQNELVCELEETAPHQHTEECYSTEKKLQCEIPLHEHTLQCYSNPEADLETAAVWEETFAHVSKTGCWAEDVLAIARTQMGYSESTENYQVQENGSSMQGYTRYGAWYGTPYEEWSATFCAFCIHYAGITDLPIRGECEQWRSELAQAGIYHEGNEYRPVAGDLVFFDNDRDGRSDHVGLVDTVTENEIAVIEGDHELSVGRFSYQLDHQTIKGFGQLPKNPRVDTQEETVQEQNPEEVLSPEEAEAVTTVPMKIDPYVVAENSEGAKTQLLYKRPEETEWTVFQNGAVLPGDASLRIEVVYENVPIDHLITSGGRLSYTVPEYMKDVKAQGNITEGNQVVGTIEVIEKTSVITFKSEFLENKKASGNSLLGGTFYIESKLDLQQVIETSPGNLVIGIVSIDLSFEEEMISKYGNLEITKSVEPTVQETEKGDYLVYTLTVKAGEYGCPDVKVADQFTDLKFIQEYDGVDGTEKKIAGIDTITEKGAPEGKDGSVYLGIIRKSNLENTVDVTAAGEAAQKPGVLIWDIGTMDANEVRTLIYRVKLTPLYTGVQAKESLTNTAEVYSKCYYRGEATVNFESKIGLDEKKTSSEPEKNEDGTYTISYKVWVKALDSNTHTLDHVKIVDSLNHSQNPTEEKYLQYLKYGEDSFVLNKGNQEKKISVTTQNHSFSCYIGDLAPGEECTLAYDLIVEPGYFIASANTAGVIKNRALLYVDDTREDGQKIHLQAYSTSRTMEKKQWNRKLVGEKITEDQSISMGGEETFNVPKGSYRYSVIVNESGDWDVSSASMNDRLNNDYMEFVGYVRVDQYDTSGKSIGGTDEEAEKALNALEPIKTVWKKIDGCKSFSVNAKDLGFPKGNYAIKMSYYAKPVNLNGVTQVVVTNRFGISGTVGYGDYQYSMPEIGVEGSVVVGNNSSFKAEKRAWYYEAAQEPYGNYSKGTVYWAIQIEGSDIPKNTQIRDVTKKGTGQTYVGNTLFEDSVVGVYRGLLEKDVTAYKDYKTLEKNLTKLNPENNYRITLEENSGNKELSLTLLENIPLTDNEKLIVLIRTCPEKIPEKKRDVYYCENSLSHRFSDGTWIEDNIARKYLYGSENILKELQEVFTWDGKTKTQLATGNGSGLAEKFYKEIPGTYVAWDIKVNYMGNLSGTYTITDHVPKGMELVYARIKWLGEGYGDRFDPSKIQYVPQKTNLGTGWMEHTISAGTDGCGERITYYYTNGQEVCWDIMNLKPGNRRDDYSVDFQVLCRVTDPGVLLGGTEKTFQNTVILTNSSGEPIGMDADSVTIGKTSLAKTGTYDPKINAGRYPFEVKLNPLGEDLIQGTDQITLVDEMSKTLKLDVSSVKVKDTASGEELSPEKYKVAVEGQKLQVTVPDNQSLTVSYETLVQAAPGETISISNKAHWDGYTASENSQVTNENFSYTAGGTVSASATPFVKIVKMDQYDVQKKLPGAQFSVVEMEFQNGELQEKDSGQSWIECETDSNGVVVIGREAGKLMKWNTVYKIQETKAPEGYLLNAAPHYVAVAKKEGETYPELLKIYENAGVTIYYAGAEYEYQALNRKGSVTIEKTFAGGDTGDDFSGVYRFGLYQIVENTETLAEKKQLTLSADGKGNSVTFHNLDLNGKYRIYELDDSDQPVQSSDTALISGRIFTVSYSDGNDVLLDENGIATMRIENRIYEVELPGTGGPGNGALYLVGFSILLLGVWLRKRVR